MFEYITSKSEWMLDDIGIEKIISAPIWPFFEFSALTDVRHWSRCNIMQHQGELMMQTLENAKNLNF